MSVPVWLFAGIDGYMNGPGGDDGGVKVAVAMAQFIQRHAMPLLVVTLEDWSSPALQALKTYPGLVKTVHVKEVESPTAFAVLTGIARAHAHALPSGAVAAVMDSFTGDLRQAVQALQAQTRSPAPLGTRDIVPPFFDAARMLLTPSSFCVSRQPDFVLAVMQEHGNKSRLLYSTYLTGLPDTAMAAVATMADAISTLATASEWSECGRAPTDVAVKAATLSSVWRMQAARGHAAAIASSGGGRKPPMNTTYLRATKRRYETVHMLETLRDKGHVHNVNESDVDLLHRVEVVSAICEAVRSDWCADVRQGMLQAFAPPVRGRAR